VSKKVFNVSQVAQAWVHSHEEDTPTTTVYRLADFPFPPSRGRKGFQLDPGGTMIARKPGPTDQSVKSDGTWKLSDDLLELSPKGGSTQSLTLDLVEPDRLIVQKASTHASQ